MPSSHPKRATEVTSLRKFGDCLTIRAFNTSIFTMQNPVAFHVLSDEPRGTFAGFTCLSAKRKKSALGTNLETVAMILNQETCYRAIQSHDARFDGRFFVGVSSTGVYCRPVCRVKTPKREHCTFFSTAAAAEALGYRPCLRCRPELAAPGPNARAGRGVAHQAAILIEEGVLSEVGVDGLAARIGVTARHLRRAFQADFGVSPIAFAQTQRLLLAKRLLTDTNLSVTDIAFAAGFNSLRRFDALFRERYRLAPKDIRKNLTRNGSADAFHFDLGYRPPYDWEAFVKFLGARAVCGVEVVNRQSYRRIIRVSCGQKTHTGWIAIAPQPNVCFMRVIVSASLAKVIPSVLSRVRHFLDLACDPAHIVADLGPLAEKNPGLRVPGAFDGFEIAVRAVLGQQVSVIAARTLAGRFAAAFGEPATSPFDEISLAFPSPESVAQCTVESVAKIGVPRTRAETILEIARAIAHGELALTPGADAPAVIERLKSIVGVGDWTAHYVAMRALAWPDAFPASDLGIMKALGVKSPKRTLEIAEAWRPWRAYAVMHLWSREKENESVF
jgi:AraC family transcriptional regulator, regulatory protein of adaptative response / DNA-3-methyladenine glycosylase II